MKQKSASSTATTSSKRTSVEPSSSVSAFASAPASTPTSSPASFAAASLTTPIRKKQRSLRDICGDEAGESPVSKVTSSPGGARDEMTSGIVVHKLEYDGGDSDDPVFAFVLSFSYPMYNFVNMRCIYYLTLHIFCSNSVFLGNAWFKIEGNSIFIQRKYSNGAPQEQLPLYEDFPIQCQLSYWTKELRSTPAAKYGYYPRPGKQFCLKYIYSIEFHHMYTIV